MTSADLLVTSVTKGHVAVVTLNRPKALNALSDGMMEQLAAALEAADADDQIRAVVLTGSDRAFSVGADISQIEDVWLDEVHLALPRIGGQGVHVGRQRLRRVPHQRPQLVCGQFGAGGDLGVALFRAGVHPVLDACGGQSPPQRLGVRAVAASNSGSVNLSTVRRNSFVPMSVPPASAHAALAVLSTLPMPAISVTTASPSAR